MTDNNTAIINRDSKGRWLPGTHANPQGSTGRKKGSLLSDLIKLKFSESMEVYVDHNITRIERRAVMADVMAQLISTGEVVFPDRMGADGKVIHGNVFKYNSESWARQLIRLLRYVEPPVQEMIVTGGVDGIIFDNEFNDANDLDGGELESTMLIEG